jgi:hypothetical protein
MEKAQKEEKKKRFALCFPSKNGYFFEALLFLIFFLPYFIPIPILQNSR